MLTTIDVENSFILVEQPVISGLCPICQQTIKKSTDSEGLPVYLSTPYKIRTIIITEDRSFEKVDSAFLHDCRKAQAEAGAHHRRARSRSWQT